MLFCWRLDFLNTTVLEQFSCICNGNKKRYENYDVSYFYVRNYVMENPKNLPELSAHASRL